MDKEIVSDAGTMIVVTARKSGTKIYFSSNVGRAQACWDTLSREWKPVKVQFGQAMKDKILAAFEELL